MEHARPWIENCDTGLDKFSDVAAHHDQILQGGNGRNEQIGLTERVAALSAFNNHGLPTNSHVFRDRENTAGKEWRKISFQPQMKIVAAGGVAQLFDAIAYFRQCDVSN